MRKVRDFIEKNYMKMIIIQIILCILLAAFIRSTSKNEQRIEFSKENLSGGHVSEEGFAFFDETDGSYGWVLDITTEEIKSGWYKVQVEYDTDYDDNGFVVQALKKKALNEDIGDEGRPIHLREGRNDQEVHAWLKEDSKVRIALLFCGSGKLQIKKIVLQQVPNYTPLILFILCIIFLNVEFYEIINLSKEEIKRRRYVRLGIAGIVLLGSIPLINDFSIYGHDYGYHIYGMEGIAEGLLSGQFPVKIMPNWWNEFGDGAPLFYADAMMYIPALTLLLGYSIQIAYKFYIVFINLLTAWITYKCFMKISKDSRIALLAAFLYTLNLYRLIDIYIRCAVGEYTALTFLPLILLGIYLIEENGWIYLALGVTGCVQSHMLVCEMTAFFFLLFCVIHIKWILRKSVFLNFCKAGVFSLLWNLWFIVPFLNMYGSNSYKIHNYSPSIEEKGIPASKLFNLYFAGLYDEIYTMGMPLFIGLAVAAMIFFIYRKRIFAKKENEKIGKLLGTSVILAFIALLLTMDFIPYTKISNVNSIVKKLISVLEFPFRFMGLAALLSVSAIVCIYILWNFELEEERQKFRVIGGIITGMFIMLGMAGALISYKNLLTSDFIKEQHDEYYTMEYKITSNKWLPLEANENETDQKLLTSSEDIVISDYNKKYTNINMLCANESTTEGYVDVPLFYYPCYKAKDEETGEVLPLTYGENARIRIVLPAGYQGRIMLKVSERKLWRITELISVLSVLAAIWLIVKRPEKKAKG